MSEPKNAGRLPASAPYFGDEDLFTWDVTSRGRGACGVAHNRSRAAEMLADALATFAPGVTGRIRLAHLDRYASQPSYVYGRVLMRARRDPRTGRLVSGGE